MVFESYDRTLERQGVIEKINSAIWTRRYWTPGDLKLIVPFTTKHRELLSKHSFIEKPGDNELAEILHIKICKNKQGKELIQVHARFLTRWIRKRLILAPIVTTDRPQNVIHRIVRENVIQPTNQHRRIGNIAAMGVTGITRSNIDYASEPFENALLACENVGKNSNLGFKIITNLRAKTHHFQVYDGKDLSVEQSLNTPSIFKEEFDNIREQEFINSSENHKTTAYVGGEERDEIPRRVVEVGQGASGLDRSEVFINASDIRQTFRNEAGVEISLTNAQVDSLLRQRGAGELNYFKKVLSYSAKIKPQSNLVYKTDYDVGDRVTCINHRWGVQLNARITEISEIYQKNSRDIEVTFGTSLPSLFESLRRFKN